MIVKERQTPLPILQLQALLRRLPPLHPKIPLITEELNKRLAGYKGEKSLEFPLSFLEKKNYFIVYDLRLQGETHFFQIDTLVLSHKFALIIESKNIAGTIFFDPVFNQLIRTMDGKETAFPDPLIQIQRHESELKSWFLKNGLSKIPIYSIVVISNPRTVIRTTPENRHLNYKVIHREVLPIKIQEIENSLSNKAVTDKELKKIIRLIKKQHTEANFSVLERYRVKKSEVLQGIICSNCSYAPLMRQYGKWFCPQCQYSCKEAHIQALKDYSLLIDSTITNRELRNFLNITSAAVAHRILKSMNLNYTGANKARVYHLSFDD